MHVYHPSRRYIYYRFSKRTDKLDVILRDMGDLNLPIPQEITEFKTFVGSLVRTRESMHVPALFAPKQRPLNQPTIDFLRRWGVHGMWLGEEAVQTAQELLYEAPLRYALEVMLLGPVSPQTIAERLRDRFALPESIMNPLVVRAYAHYFWDYTALTPAQWTNLIFNWMPKGDKSVLLMALRAPRTPSGASMVLSIADGDIDKIRPQEMFDSIRNHAWRAFMQHATTDLPSLARTQAMLYAFQIVRESSDAGDAHRGGDNELVAALSRFEAKTGPQTTATIYDIPLVRELPPDVVADATAVTEAEEKTT